MNASGFRTQAREALRGRWLLAVGTTFIATILGGSVLMVDEGYNVSSGTLRMNNGQNQSNMNGGVVDMNTVVAVMPIIATIVTIITIAALVHFLVGGFISLGLIKFNLAMVDGNQPKFGDIFSQSNRFVFGLWLRLRMQIFTFLWTLLLIIPGIVKSYSYSMAGFIAYENPDMTAKEAMEVSMAMMKGNKWRLFCLQISFIGWAILSIFTAGIGLLWVDAYSNAAITAFYNEISRDYQAHIN